MEYSDRRVRKTRAAINTAIISLLKRKNFHDITIQDIADEADIGKATFYRHYPDKYALVEDLVLARLEIFYHKMRINPKITMTLENLQQLRAFVIEIKPFRGINQSELNVDRLIKDWLAEFLESHLSLATQGNLYSPHSTAKIMAATLLELLDEYDSGEVQLTPENIKHQLSDLRSVLASFDYQM
ncbi:TetR/AcrR family transcriptional regulator [Enterococcus sp. DIV0876]|uniref:TetR/AcrR family transcriptional regulator n=1 Tax=Enterococcus sp. DIV0876 TaxID=2774633 RepID=UPI003D2F9C3E